MFKKILAGLLTAAVLITGITVPAKAETVYTTIGANQTITADLSSSSETDWYRFTFAEDGILTLNFNKVDPVADVGWGWHIKVLDESGDIASVDQLKKEHTFGQLPFKKGAVIYISISNSYSGGWTKGADYKLTANFKTDPNWEAESNNTMANSKTIAVNTNYRGTMYLSNDVDYYKLPVTKDGIFQLEFQPANVGESVGWGWEISIVNQDGNVISHVDQNKGKYTFGKLPMAAGNTLYVKVENSYSGSPARDVEYVINFKGEYDSSWEAESNDTMATAKQIVVNKDYKGTMYLSSDVDYYKLPISKNGVYELNFRPADVSAEVGWGWEISIINQDGNVISRVDQNKGKYTFGKLPMGAGNTLYVKVENSYSGSPALNAEYILNIKAEYNSLWESEYNNSRKTADNIQLGKTHYGTMMTNTDEDFYKVEIKENGILGISLRSSLENNQDKVSWGWDVIITDKNGNVLTNGELKQVKTKDAMSVKVKKGTYYIKVVSDYSNGSPVSLIYELTTNFVKTANAKDIKVPTIKGKTITLKWKALSGISGYQLRYSAKSNMSKAKTVKIAKNKTSYTIKNLKAKTKYYIQIRAYKSVVGGKTIYGNWSSKKTVTTKK